MKKPKHEIIYDEMVTAVEEFSKEVSGELTTDHIQEAYKVDEPISQSKKDKEVE
ncbi:hypothetical protein [Desertibacillus haloalkaliphilus]|uniref:hypothetical protein n=1 Tax=Desertibacillus haloalkaliphilus TaxID=1328930 RepID=UPI001C26C380|nr:hypothetical protein [Desertibacillus haloalkaliphilus]MBU8906623.1 hypothetical protein [Desertibacillus haloalkaliphilus]